MLFGHGGLSTFQSTVLVSFTLQRSPEQMRVIAARHSSVLSGLHMTKLFYCNARLPGPLDELVRWCWKLACDNGDRITPMLSACEIDGAIKGIRPPTSGCRKHGHRSKGPKRSTFGKAITLRGLKFILGRGLSLIGATPCYPDH